MEEAVIKENRMGTEPVWSLLLAMALPVGRQSKRF